MDENRTPLGEKEVRTQTQQTLDGGKTPEAAEGKLQVGVAGGGGDPPGR